MSSPPDTLRSGGCQTLKLNRSFAPRSRWPAAIRTRPCLTSLTSRWSATQARRRTYGERFGDWTDPNAPFGDLLRQAFAADQVDAMSSAAWLSEEPMHVAQQERILSAWQSLVIDRFAQLYQLWSN